MNEIDMAYGAIAERRGGAKRRDRRQAYDDQHKADRRTSANSPCGRPDGHRAARSAGTQERDGSREKGKTGKQERIENCSKR
jgi:hypothetical protein